jgi:anti-sigma factor RsiW
VHQLEVISKQVQDEQPGGGSVAFYAEPDKVAGWFRGKVGFPVRPVQFREPQVQFLGARISHVRERQAAALYYSVNGHRVTMVIFEPPTTLRAVARRTRIGDTELYYQHVHGYTVPIMEHDGIAYTFTGDLDRQSLLRLAASAQMR